MQTTWRKQFLTLFEITGDSFDGLVCTLSQEKLDTEFYAGYGNAEGPRC